MTLASLEVTGFRCIERARLEFDPRLTVITGENASGKTSLLEAIFFLSCGRSFRSPQLDPLIRTGQSDFTVVGHVSRDGHPLLTLGVRGSRRGTEARLGGQPAKGFSQMAEVLPVQVIDPEVHRLLEDGPSHRRRFVDWGVFHVEPGFLLAWRRYQRALKQRNAALKAKLGSPEIRVWDADLVEAGEFIAARRREYVQALAPWAAAAGQELLGITIQIAIHQGWPAERTYEAALQEAWSRDTARGVTTVGPHRADLMVRIEDFAAKDRVSRGQQKLLASALLLAQIQHRGERGGALTSLLLDDPAAELDVDNLRKLLALVDRVPAQLIATALDADHLELSGNGRMFHVKQGRVEPVLYSRPR